MTTELVELADRLDRQAAGNGSDRANALSRCADELRALASRAGGWLPIDSAPTKQRVLVRGGDTPNGTAIATCDPGRYTPWHESHDELPMVRSWYADTRGGRSIWPHPTHWQPLPEPPAAPEPVAVGPNNLSNDEENV